MPGYCLQNQVDIDSDPTDSKSDLDKPPRRSTKTRHEPKRNVDLAHHIAMLTAAQSTFQELLTHHKALNLLKADL